jgi:hypothetical protein
MRTGRVQPYDKTRSDSTVSFWNIALFCFIPFHVVGVVCNKKSNLRKQAELKGSSMKEKEIARSDLVLVFLLSSLF